MEKPQPASEERASFRVGVNAFVVRDGKLLLGQRKGGNSDGAWGMPGGHLEDKESMLEAAARELAEETGLRASTLQFILLVNNRQRDRHYIQTGFLAEGVRGEPELKEPELCYEWRWCDLDNLPEPIFIGHQKLIELYKEGATNFGEA